MTIAGILSAIAFLYLVVGLLAGGIKAITIPEQRQVGFKMMVKAIVAFVVLSIAALFATNAGL